MIQFPSSLSSLLVVAVVISSSAATGLSDASAEQDDCNLSITFALVGDSCNVDKFTDAEGIFLYLESRRSLLEHNMVRISFLDDDEMIFSDTMSTTRTIQITEERSNKQSADAPTEQKHDDGDEGKQYNSVVCEPISQEECMENYGQFMCVRMCSNCQLPRANRLKNHKKMIPETYIPNLDHEVICLDLQHHLTYTQPGCLNGATLTGCEILLDRSLSSSSSASSENSTHPSTTSFEGDKKLSPYYDDLLLL